LKTQPNHGTLKQGDAQYQGVEKEHQGHKQGQHKGHGQAQWVGIKLGRLIVGIG